MLLRTSEDWLFSACYLGFSVPPTKSCLCKAAWGNVWEDPEGFKQTSVGMAQPPATKSAASRHTRRELQVPHLRSPVAVRQDGSHCLSLTVCLPSRLCVLCSPAFWPWGIALEPGARSVGGKTKLRKPMLLSSSPSPVTAPWGKRRM